jgi:subtilisin family serine protease
MAIRSHLLTTRALAALTVLVAPLFAACATPVQVGPTRTYMVLYAGQPDPVLTEAGIARAGGTQIANYGRIGVAVARSSDPAFVGRLRHTPGVVEVASTARHAVRLRDGSGLQNSHGPDDSVGTQTGVQDNQVGSLAGLQWDMKQIHAPEAHLVTQGSHRILAGVIDTGIDFTHPNLAPNMDFENSVSCIGGQANQSPSAWNDDNGHGTHVAGTIAASSQEDHLGIDGVAPGVRISAIKAGDADGDFFPEAVVCAFMWAGSHHFSVTNNSYFADPWYYNCLDDPEQLAIWTAEKRAIDYAIGNGVTVVAAAGNYNDNLANPTIDAISPDFPPGKAIVRVVNENCFVVPAMVPNVITVSADGNKLLKSYYSSFGSEYIKVTAPGGDSVYQQTADAPNGRVLSTFPANPNIRPGTARVVDCTPDGQCATFAYLQGTSMASPHVAGLVALIMSRFSNGSSPLTPAQVLERLTSSADPLACPPDPFNPTVPSPRYVPGNPPAHCEGSSEYNSFYGFGQINALRAVTG